MFVFFTPFSKYITRFIFSFLLALSITVVQAGEVLTLSISQGGQTQNRDFNSLEELFDTVQQQPDSFFPNFDSTLASSATLNYLGQNVEFTSGPFVNGSQTLRLVAPSLGVNKTFTGTGNSADAARDNAYDQLEDYLETNADDFFQKLQQAVAANNPNSVIAGNPNSIQTKTVTADFDAGFTQQVSKIDTPAEAKIPNLFGANVTYGRFKQDDTTVSSWTLPLSYAFRSQENPQRQLILSLPISYGTIGSSKAYAGSLGVSAVLPVWSNWRITPSVGYGLAASVDLGQAAQQVSASVTSAYEWELPGSMGMVAMGNMVGHYRTLKLKVGDFSIDPGIQNTVVRNGLIYAYPITIPVVDQKLSLEFGYTNTHFFGSKTYTRNQNELGIAIGNRLDGADDNILRAGLTYVQAKDSNGIRVVFSYWF